MSCLIKIKEGMASFTKSEKKIAQYILENSDEVIIESTQQLAKKIGTSAATLVRFAKTLSYNGFPELKIDLAKGMSNQEEDLIQVLKPTDSVQSLVTKTIQHKLINLEKLLQLTHINQIEKAANLIQQANRIYLVGVGASGLVCRDLFHKFVRIGKDAQYSSDVHVGIAQLNGINDKDVLIAVSYSGETHETILACTLAKKRGAKIIGISQIGKTPLSKLVDVHCFIPRCEDTLRIGAIESRDASLCIGDLLYLCIAMQSFETTNQKLKSSRQWVKKI